MSSREPMWFCHECHAEMRPLMVPDPACASCRSSFVEKIENPEDDPRAFVSPEDAAPGHDNGDPSLDTFLVGLQSLLGRGASTPASAPSQTSRSQGPRVTLQFQTGSGPHRTFTFGRASSPPPLPRTTNRSSRSPPPGDAPTMSEFLRTPPGAFPSDADRIHDRHHAPEGSVPIPIVMQYIMSLLGGNQEHAHAFMPFLMPGMPPNGRMGDYVFTQDALDQIITQLMESTNAHRPVPASEEVINKLPREVLVEGSPLLTKDCAVCKDQFQLNTEDPDEQIIITLPCNHPFHSTCILPWLKSSGTCPVCRHALVAQPDRHSSSPPSSGPSSSSGAGSSSSSGPGGNSGRSGGAGSGNGQGFSFGFNFGSSPRPSGFDAEANGDAGRERSQSPAEARAEHGNASGNGNRSERAGGEGWFSTLLTNLTHPNVRRSSNSHSHSRSSSDAGNANTRSQPYSYSNFSSGSSWASSDNNGRSTHSSHSFPEHEGRYESGCYRDNGTSSNLTADPAIGPSTGTGYRRFGLNPASEQNATSSYSRSGERHREDNGYYGHDHHGPTRSPSNPYSHSRSDSRSHPYSFSNSNPHSPRSRSRLPGEWGDDNDLELD